MAKVAKAELIGRNIRATVDGDKLTLEIDLSEKAEASASGKTMIVATSKGNKKLGDVFVGVNVYKYKDKKAK